jgi:hypothetical protein
MGEWCCQHNGAAKWCCQYMAKEVKRHDGRMVRGSARFDARFDMLRFDSCVYTPVGTNSIRQAAPRHRRASRRRASRRLGSIRHAASSLTGGRAARVLAVLLVSSLCRLWRRQAPAHAGGRDGHGAEPAPADPPRSRAGAPPRTARPYKAARDPSPPGPPPSCWAHHHPPAAPHCPPVSLDAPTRTTAALRRCLPGRAETDQLRRYLPGGIPPGGCEQGLGVADL